MDWTRDPDGLKDAMILVLRDKSTVERMLSQAAEQVPLIGRGRVWKEILNPPFETAVCKHPSIKTQAGRVKCRLQVFFQSGSAAETPERLRGL